MTFETVDNMREQRRAAIARDLAKFYADELPREKPQEKFSLVRMIDAMAQQSFKKGSSHEANVVHAAAMAQGGSFDPQRVVVPWGVLANKRDLATAPPSLGGYLVGTEVATPIDILRPYSVTAKMGVSSIHNLTQNLLIPNMASATSGQWLSTEGTSATASDGVIGHSSATPKTASAIMKASYQFMKQAAQAEQFIRQQLLAAVGNLLDRAILQGTGSSGQPLGMANAPGLGAQSGAVTHSNMLDILQTLGNANVNDENIKFITTPAIRRALQAREIVSTSGKMIWDCDEIACKPASVSTDVPTATIFAGDWSQCLVAFWGTGVEIQVDPYTSFTTGAVQIRALLHADVVLPKPAAFVRHTSAS